MNIDPGEYTAIEAEIQSAESPVGIDAKKTHVYIIHMLREIQTRLASIETRLKLLESA